jgi:hypothetical protein
VDAHGPWNTGGDWEVVEAPALQELKRVPAQVLEAKTRAAKQLVHRITLSKNGCWHKAGIRSF